MGVPVDHLLRRLEVEADDIAARDAEHLERAIAFVQFLGEVVRGAPGAWASEAACKGYSHLFFAESGEPTGPAKALCEVCTVAPQCRAWGDEQGTAQVGLLAGETGRQRAKRRAQGARTR